MLRWPFRFALLAGLGVVSASCVALTEHDEPWPCANDSDCLDGEHCLSDSGRSVCLEARPCAVNDECPVAHWCVGGTGAANSGLCVLLSCTAAEADPCRGPLCDTATFRCRVSCEASGDCSAGYRCDAGACVRGTCTASDTSQCGGARCLIEGLCGAGCASAADCEGARQCAASQCR